MMLLSRQQEERPTTGIPGTIQLTLPSSPGTDTEYIVTVQDAWGCLDSDTVNVTVNPLPDAQAGDDQDICLGETATLTANNGNNYHWSTGDDLQSHTGQPGNIHRNILLPSRMGTFVRIPIP